MALVWHEKASRTVLQTSNLNCQFRLSFTNPFTFIPGNRNKRKGNGAGLA